MVPHIRILRAIRVVVAADVSAPRIILMERHVYTELHLYNIYKYLRVTHTHTRSTINTLGAKDGSLDAPGC